MDSSQSVFSPLMTEAELARCTGTSPRFWRRLRQRGAGPTYVQLGERTIRYERDAVERWLAKRRKTPGKQPLELITLERE